MRKTASPLSAIGIRIEAIRVRKNKPLGQLAIDAKWVYSHLYRVMHGVTRPSRGSLLRICKALNCTVDEAASIFEVTEFRAPSADELEDIARECVLV